MVATAHDLELRELDGTLTGTHTCAVTWQPLGGSVSLIACLFPVQQLKHMYSARLRVKRRERYTRLWTQTVFAAIVRAPSCIHEAATQS
jgi:hypothetical protein